MVHCCIINCKSDNARKEDNITFHRFPRDPTVCSRWIAVTGRSDWQPTPHARVCSRHFEDRWFRWTKNATFLIPGAIPTLFVWNLEEPNKSNIPLPILTDSEVDAQSLPCCNCHVQSIVTRKLNVSTMTETSYLDVDGETSRKSIRTPLQCIPQQRDNQHNSHEECIDNTDPLDISIQERRGGHDVSQEAHQYKIPAENLMYTECIDNTDPLIDSVNNSCKGSSENKCSIFGSFVAQRLSQLSRRNRLIAQKQIGDILYELEMEEVSYHEDNDSETQSDSSTEEMSIKSEPES